MKLLLLPLIAGLLLLMPKSMESNQAKEPTTFYYQNQPIPPGTVVFQFNSHWNAQNEYKWIETSKAKYFEFDLDKNPAAKTKYQIKSVPTIIIFKNGKEFKRYEGGLQMKITTPIQVIQKDL